MSYSKKLAPLALALPLFSACLGGGTDTKAKTALYDLPEADAVIVNIGTNVIFATYTELNTKMIALNTAAQSLAANRDAASLTAAQDAWKAARIPWESTESFLIGPVDALGIDPKLDTWPLATSALNAVIGGSDPLTPAFVHNLDTNLQGFHTAEYLLFGDGIATNTRSVGSLTDREYEYLVAVTAVMAEHTAQLVTAWSEHFDPEDTTSPAFLDVFTLKTPSQTAGFTNRAQVLATIVQDGMAGIADEVGNGKLATPLAGSLAEADPSQVESQFSWNSLADFQNNVASISNLYTGDYGTHTGAGLDSLVQQVDMDLDFRIQAEIEFAKARIAAIAGAANLPFTQAIKDPAARERVQAAIDQMNSLKRILEEELAPLVK